jgi:hypothetical protein
MGKDPLDLLGDLPDWPGNTPPKNRKTTKYSSKIALDRYNGAKPVIYKINGVDRPMFSVGKLAQALGRKAVTIRVWEHKGWIPRATYRTPPPRGQQLPGAQIKGRRLYSQEQVDFLIEALEKYNIQDTRSPDWVEFRSHIQHNWPKA